MSAKQDILDIRKDNVEKVRKLAGDERAQAYKYSTMRIAARLKTMEGDISVFYCNELINTLDNHVDAILRGSMSTGNKNKLRLV